MLKKINKCGGHYTKMDDLLPGSIFSIAMASLMLMTWGKLKSRAYFIYAGWAFLNIELLILVCMIISAIAHVPFEVILLMDIILILPLGSFLVVRFGRRFFIRVIGFTLLNFELLAILIAFFKKLH
ncbi:MAG: hypothetical protein V1860_00355 [bacterium]